MLPLPLMLFFSCFITPDYFDSAMPFRLRHFHSIFISIAIDISGCHLRLIFRHYAAAIIAITPLLSMPFSRFST
jgi:hypothetical protein